MTILDEQKEIVILIDADNAQLTKQKSILEIISKYGHIKTKKAYGDWSSESLKNWKATLNKLTIEAMQQFAYTNGKNATDALMIVDAMDMLYRKEHDIFVLVSSDSDFIPLVNRLKKEGIYVLGVGENKAPVPFKDACDEFIYTEKIGETKSNPKPSASKDQSLQDLIPALKKAWELHQDDDGWADISVAGGYLRKINPHFDPRTYNATKFSEIIEKLRSTFRMRRRKGKGTTTIVKYKPTKNASL